MFKNLDEAILTYKGICASPRHSQNDTLIFEWLVELRTRRGCSQPIEAKHETVRNVALECAAFKCFGCIRAERVKFIVADIARRFVDAHYLELKAFGQWLMQRHALQLSAEDCAEAGIRAYERTDGYQREDD